MKDLKDIVKEIVSQIVTDEKAVVVEENEEEGVTSFFVTVAKEDMGKIIGKEGRVIRAIRNVMKIPAIKQGKRIQISLQEIAP